MENVIFGMLEVVDTDSSEHYGDLEPNITKGKGRFLLNMVIIEKKGFGKTELKHNITKRGADFISRIIVTTSVDAK